MRVSSSPAVKTWPWEGCVQNVFAQTLIASGWVIDAVADTATKAPGVDVLAHKDTRTLGAEVKGFPSSGYEDPSRAGERKRSSPNSQARNWFAKAILAALMLREAHPGRESLIVLPDHARYRSLVEATRSGLEAAAVHVVLLSPDGQVESRTWTA